MDARIGIDLGGTKIEGVLIDQAGDILRRVRVDTPRNDYRATLAAVGELVGDLEAGRSSGLPVGIGTPGVWVESRGRMKNCNSTWLNGQPLKRDLEALLGRVVALANDADCFALAEARTGAAAGATPVFGVILGTGVGGGIVIDGRLLRGASGLAGEWGHTPMPYLRADPHCRQMLGGLEDALPDRTCYCGRVNCIESFLSGPGLAQTHRALHGGDSTARDIGKQEDTRAVRSLQARSVELYCFMLARSLAQIINVIDPACIVLGGGVSNIASLYPRVNALVRHYVFSYECEARIVRAHHGDSGGVIGAAWLQQPGR